MNVLITMEDFPADDAHCGNCTRKGGGCQRSKSDKQVHNGYIYNPVTREVSGIIYRCPNYTGDYKPKTRRQ